MIAQPSKLDTDKFAKVHRLMKEGATEGERTAARARAEAMAARAGMTLKQAASKVDSKPRGFAHSQQPAGPTVRDIFEGFDDWMERKEPGYKARKAEQATRKEAERKIDVARIMCHYGSEDALFAETEREKALRVALAPLANYSTYSNWADLAPDHRQYISGYDGWTCREPTPALWAALSRAFPLPTTLEQAWAEYCEWETLGDDRATVDSYYGTPIHVRARVAGIEHLLDTMSDPSVSGFRARLGWLRHTAYRDCARDPGEDRMLACSLERDFAILRKLYEAPAQNGQASPAPPADMRRTNADKQRDVLSMLDAGSSLTDREIARRCGVSPQTVGNWRKRRVAS